LEPGAPATAAGPSIAPRPPEPVSPPATPPPARTPAPVRSAKGPSLLVYVRIVKAGRPVEVGSETIDLNVDDIVSLPAETAKLLIDAHVAEAVATSAVPSAT
jgi:hypothetical protein